MSWGIEIETLIPGTLIMRRNVALGLAQEISAAGVSCSFAGYSHATAHHWKIVTDASVTSPTPGYVGLEIVSPPLDDDPGFNQIDVVCNVLTRMHARTNRTCGLHVHIGVQQFVATNGHYARPTHKGIAMLRRLVLLYLENEDIIDSLLPPSRRSNNNFYCRSIKINADLEALNRATNISDLARAVFNDRYSKLNLHSYLKHSTVEFRQHSGTVDPVKIKYWIKLCKKFVEIANEEPGSNASANAVVTSNPELARRLARARQLRIIFEAVTRPEGATSIEVQSMLQRATPPALSNDLARLGVTWTSTGRRNGHRVYKVVLNTMSPTSLATMLEKLRLNEEEAEFWRQRQRLLEAANMPHDLAE